MKTPSIKTLSRVFGNPGEAKRVLQMSHKELADHPAGAKRIAECYNPPAWNDVRLTVLNSLDAGLHGVELIMCANRHDYAEYLNTGDTYTDTLIYWRGNYRVQSIGDFIERTRVAFL